MWTFAYHSLTIVNFLLLTAETATGSSTVNLEEKLSAIDSLIRHAREEFHVPGMAVGIVVNGRTVFAEGYGLRNHEDSQSHVSNRTLFAIGSCTKAFTTYLLECLVQVDRILAWSDLVISRIPEFRLNDVRTWSRIQIKDLVTHVSGLPAHDLVWAYSNCSKDELLARISHLQANHDLREKYQYNNLMYVVAGLVIERMTGQSWEDVVRDRIFEPLNMSRSYCSIRDERLSRVDDVAVPHSAPTFVEHPSDVSITNISWMDTSIIGPAASIISSVEDMTKWIKMQLELSKSFREMHTVHVAIPTNYPSDGENFGYGLGWGTAFYHGRYMLGHSGLTAGFSSRVSLFPDEKQGIVILANLNSLLHELRNLTCRIADILADHISTVDLSNAEWVSEQGKFRAGSLTSMSILSEDSREWRSVDRPEEYVGHFENAGYGTVDVFFNETRLFASYDRDRLRFILEPKKGPDFFNARSEFPREAYHECSFVRNSSGHVIGCRFDFEPSVSPIFFEKKSGDDLHATPFEDFSRKVESIVQVNVNEEKESLVVSRASKYFEEL